MSRAESQTFLRVLMVIAAALVLTVLILGILLAITQPAQANSQAKHLQFNPMAAAQPVLAPVAIPLKQSGVISIVKSATTLAAPANGSLVADGGWITYTITVQNNTGSNINNLEIVDFLQANTFEEGSIQPLGGYNYTFFQVTTVLTDGRGNAIATVTETQRITWPVASLANGQSVTRQFQARVICRADGSDFNNFAVVYYNNGANSELSNQVNTLVQVSPPSAGGQAGVSNAPTFCSTEPGGAYDMDWGDYDRDGDLDLALGFANFGVKVYRNDVGQFTELSVRPGGFSLLGVHWADVIPNNNSLELIVIGEYTCCYVGNNFIYSLSGGGFTPSSSFNSDDGLFRVAAADYDRNGSLDLATAVYWDFGSATPCKARLHPSSGPGSFYNYNAPQTTCLITNSNGIPVRSIAWGDYDNNGYPDVAAGTYNGTIRLFPNSGVSPYLNSTTGITVDTGLGPLYDLAWGDYDGNSYLDLAAAYSQNSVRIYRNLYPNPLTATSAIIINTASPVYAVDWVDFNGDGNLELAVADNPSKVYNPNNPSTPLVTLPTVGAGLFYNIQGIDHDNDGDLDLTFSNVFAKSLLFSTVAPFLSPTLTPISPPSAASGVAWGDANSDGRLDLLLGTTASANKLYTNGSDGIFSAAGSPFLVNGRSVAFGNVDGDTDLDIAFGRSGKNQLYLNNGGYNQFPDWTSGPSYDTYSLVFGDFDQDNNGQLELLGGNNNGPIILYNNSGLRSGTSEPLLIAPASAQTRQVAWGYYDSDILPDFAIANEGQSTQIYRNEGGNVFTLAQSLAPSNARSVAWGDYDHDGDMDLVIGNYGQSNQLYENNGGNLTLISTWTLPAYNTTSVAWGDWDNDGDLDLAVGNNGQPDQVYVNLGSQPGVPRLFLLWQSQTNYSTQNAAWGDADGDGDLDLAIAAASQSGFYRNNYVAPAHLAVSNFAQYMPLPYNPSYLSIARPGNPDQIWKKSLITQSNSLTIPITFTVFDPDGSRQTGINASGDQVKILSYQYSLNGGAWLTATGTPATGTILTPPRQGITPTFQWSAWQDLNTPAKAVSDDFRFRITIAHLGKAGPVQHAMTAAVSPPFRVRNLSCVWPETAGINIQTTPPFTFGIPIQFVGTIAQGSGPITFTWDFGDNSTSGITQGLVIPHTYALGGVYTVKLMVIGQPCPISRNAVATTIIVIAGEQVYLPLVLKSSAGGATSTAATPETSGVTTPEASGEVFSLNVTPGSPAQVTGLQGSEPGDGTTTLVWNPNPADDVVLGYRVYRSPIGAVSFQRLADLPTDVITYTDATATCGQMYFVTAYNAEGESLPSTASYFSLPCP